MTTVLEHNKENQPLCKAIMDLTHLKYDLPLHKQLEELYLSTKETINYMDETRNKASKTLSRKKLQKLINTNPRLAHKEIFKDNSTQSRTGLWALRDPETNTIETEPTKQAQIVEKYFSDTMKAVNIKVANICQKTHPEITLCKAIMDLTHLKYDLPLHKQLEELYLSTKETINYMDETRNKESKTLSRKKQQKTDKYQPQTCT